MYILNLILTILSLTFCLIYFVNMAENEVKIIKYSITMLLAGREHSKHELLKKLLIAYFEGHLCIECIDKFNQNNLQSNVRFTESLIRGR
jgi:SOS response regulatory protein OraA/RecX